MSTKAHHATPQHRQHITRRQINALGLRCSQKSRM